ncbi:MAG TPA: hypothetical protein ENN34_03340 [Deltaproteobacteria bacterium]|nr:hypothetical protein [Deltaproteobacteria bacterium]
MILGLKKGYSVVLGDDEHSLCSFRVVGEKVFLKGLKTLDSSSLKRLSRRGRCLKVCFSPRSVYADIGEFTSVSEEATAAHIRASVDKIGLFKEEYQIASCKMNDLDGSRARFSYIVTPMSEIEKIGILDEREAVLDSCCPIEAALASAVAKTDRNMVVTVYEDARFVRIIASKRGMIHYLITISSAESYDLVSETVSGIQEMFSLLKNSYHEHVSRVFKVGSGEITTQDLNERGIQAEPLPEDALGDETTMGIVLFGTAITTQYDFTPQSYCQTKRILRYSRISLALSLVLLAVSAALFSLGMTNADEAEAYQKDMQEAYEKSIHELRALEQDYLALSSKVDLSQMNTIIETYQAFQAEPKLHLTLSAISENVPGSMFIQKIEVSRPVEPDAGGARVVPPPMPQHRALKISSFSVEIDGIVDSPYPLSKSLFTRYLTDIQKRFVVKRATFSHTEKNAVFSITCETTHEIL